MGTLGANTSVLCYNVDIIEKHPLIIEGKGKMRNSKKTEKSQKNQEKELIFKFLKKKFLYKAKKKIIKKDSVFEHFFCLEENISSEKQKEKDKAAEKALNNKEAPYIKASMYPLTFIGNNSDVFEGIRVICAKKRIFNEKQENGNLLFGCDYNTNNIFCVNKG